MIRRTGPQNMRYDPANNHCELGRPNVPSGEERCEQLTRLDTMIHNLRATLISFARQLWQLLITRHEYGHRAGRIAEVVMLEQLINIRGFTPDPFKIVDIEATLKSRGDSPDLMRLQEIHVIMGNWAALVCFASQLWHGRCAAITFSESVYGDRMSKDRRGTSSKPDTFDPRALSHTAKEALICLPNLRSQFVELTNKLAMYDPAEASDARIPRTTRAVGGPKATLTVRNRKRANPELELMPSGENMNQDLALDNAGSSGPRGPCPLVMSTPVNIASIATAIKHARANQLHLLEFRNYKNYAIQANTRTTL